MSERKQTCDLVLIDPALWSWGCHLAALMLTSQSVFCSGYLNRTQKPYAYNLLRDVFVFTAYFTLYFLQFFIHLFHFVSSVVITCQTLRGCQNQTYISHSWRETVKSPCVIHSPPCFPTLCCVDRLRTLSTDRCVCTQYECICVYSLVNDGCVCGR